MPQLPYLTALPMMLLAPLLGGQGWQSGDALPAVRAAAAARTQRDLTSAVAGWQAEAHGVVQFVVRIDHGGLPVERVMKVDELRVEVYGEAPSRSKQRIVAWRDSLLRPTTIRYHRDHLGIVAHDFGPTIRLGQGEEVRDVPHPLSASGFGHYQFREADTIRVASATDTLRVVAIEVRPADGDAAGVVGTLFLDIDRAALVRFQFTFTPASYRDPTVERIAVVLENALHERQQWLPHRQSITIDRASPLVVLPISTRIRADWEIDAYQLDLRHPAGRFAGAAIDGLQAPGGAAWPLPMVMPSGGDEVAFADELSDLARQLTGRRLDGLPVVRLAGRDGLSSFLHVNRVEGVALGSGVRWTPGGATRLSLDGTVATRDGRLTGGVAIEHPGGAVGWRLIASRRVEDLLDDPTGSTLANSFATALTGGDARDWHLRDRLAAELQIGDAAIQGTLMVGYERVRRVTAGFVALDGTVRDNPGVGKSDAPMVRVGGTWNGGTMRFARLRLELGSGSIPWSRADLHLGGTVARQLTAELHAGIGSEGLPLHRAFVLGGRGSLVGHPTRRWWGRRVLRLELARPFDIGIGVPHLPGIPPVGAIPSRVAPFVAVAAVGGALPLAPGDPTGRLEATLGLRLDLWGPVLRVEVGWDPRRGHVGVTLDAHPDWWPML
jgi:hypothetical protein